MVILLLAVFGFYAAFCQRTLQYDEAYTLRHFAINPGIALLSYTEPNNHMLHSLLVWLSTTLMGFGLIAIRLPTLMLALLSVALIFRVGRKLGGWRVGIAAAAFLSVNRTFADYAVNARGYTLSIFLALVLVDLVFLSPPKHTRRYRYGLLFTCLALMITLPTHIILIAGVLAWLVWRSLYAPMARRAYRQSLLAVVIGTLLGSIFYLPSALLGQVSRSFERFGYTDLGALASGWLDSIFGGSLLGVLLLFCLIVGLVGLLRKRDRRLLQITLSLAGVTLAAVLVQFVVLGRTFYERNFLYLLPIVCLFAALGLKALTRRWTLLAVVAMLIGAVLLLPPSLSAKTVVDQMITYIDTQLSSRDMVLVSNFADEPMIYTLQEGGEWDRLLLPDKDRLVVFAQAEDELPPLFAAYGLTPYVDQCAPLPAISDTFRVFACSLRQTEAGASS